MSFPRYERYKDSGIEWLGEVPEHWEILALKRIASICYGIGEPPKYQIEGIPLIRATNIHGGRLFEDGLVFVNPEDIPEKRIVWLSAGDIIVVRSGAYTGDSAIIPKGYGSCIAGFDMVLRCDGATPYFVQFALLSKYLKEGQIDLEKMRAAQPHLNAEELGNSIIVIPSSREEQTEIVAFLTRETIKIDTLIAEQQRLIELLKEKRQAVISHAVTKGLNPDAPMKDSGIEWLGDVPEHWEVKRLKFIANVQTGVAKGKDNTGKITIEVPYLRVANVQDGYLDLDDVATIELPVDDLQRYELQANDVLMNEGGDFDKLGRGHIWDGSISPCIHQNHVFAVRPFGVSSDWLNIITGSAYAQFYFMSRSKQSTNLASISSTNIMELPVVVPPTDEQVIVLNWIDVKALKFDQLIQDAGVAITLLQERRTALISAAVTGKIDVRGQVATQPEREAAA